MLPYSGQDVEVTITVICEYITNRFRQYETIANVFGPPVKTRDKKRSHLPGIEITAGAAIIGEGEGAGEPGGGGGQDEVQDEDEYDNAEYDDEYEDEEVDGEYADEDQYKAEHHREAESKQTKYKNDEVDRPAECTYTELPPDCLFCWKQDMPAQHWMSDCKKVKTSSNAELQQMGFCTLCLYLKKTNSQHLCKSYFSRNKLFCQQSGVHRHLYSSPSTHERTVLLDSVAESYEDDAEEDKLLVLRAQGVRLEDYDTTDNEYCNEHDSGHTEGYDDW